MLRRGYTRETAIRRDRRGRWFNGDERIEHPGVVRSFDGWIDRADDGRYCLRNAINWAYVAIEGPPYFVRSVRVVELGVVLALSGEGEELLDARTLRTGPDEALWCDVRAGLPARFDPHAQQGLAALVDEDEAGVFLRIGDEAVRPPRVDDPLRGPQQVQA